MINKDLTVIISSCDDYNILWDDFYKCFKANWGIDCEIIFISESKNNSNFKTITPGFKPWGQRQLEALNEVKTELVFWLLDDYFLCYKYSPHIFEKYINDFFKMDMDRLQISPDNYIDGKFHFERNNTKLHTESKYEMIDCNLEYSVTLQPSIWRKSYIKKILQKEYSPWDFEIKGSKMNKSKKVYIDRSIKYLPYFNAVRKKNFITISRIIRFLDKLILKIFYNKLPFKYSKGYNKFFKNKSYIDE